MFQIEVLIAYHRIERDVGYLLLFALCSLAISIERFSLTISHCLSGRHVKYCASLIRFSSSIISSMCSVFP